MPRTTCPLILISLIAACLPLELLAFQERVVDFSRDIRPIFSDTCYKCHGPDAEAREADLRFDSRENVFVDLEVVVAGDPDESELYLRLISDDADMLMPPPESGRSLSPDQIRMFRNWIEQGAKWGPHWSLATPTKPALPIVGDGDWPRNEIDHFVLHQIELQSMKPSVEADRRTLARRLALDLTGLPPTAKQLNEFLTNTSGDAYEEYVDALIATPQYGEHMARYWLDIVRYGDTHGLHLDNYREHWPYRDWIINAFNSNQPYDQFSIEQLAGDLLDNPARDQLIATGFNRSHVTTNEGGSIKDEIKVRNVVDRTATFGTVFLGLTVGCAQCHDHKFDPISQREFYSLFAYFNSLDGDPMDGNVKDHAPVLMVGTTEQLKELENLNTEIETIKKTIAETVANWKYVEPDDPPGVNPEPVEDIWIDDELPESEIKTGEWKPTSEESQPVHHGKVSFIHKAEGGQQYVIQKTSQPWEVNEKDELFAYVYLDPEDPPRQIMLQWNDGNWEHRAFWGENLIEWGQKNSPSRLYQGPLPKLGEWVRLSVPAEDVNLPATAKINGVALTQFDGTLYWDSVGKVTHLPPFPANRSLKDWIDEQIAAKGEKLNDPLKKIINSEREKWSDEDRQALLRYFVEFVYSGARDVISPLEKKRGELTKQRDESKAKIPTTLIFRETAEPKEAFLLNRGMYDQPKDKVSRGIPAAFPPLPEGIGNDRLALATWLFSDQHPLTARVTVNRFWQQVFGIGIVETSEDFGAQGTFPTHPDLLDFLAVDFRDHNWDVKRLMKQFVMSATYRQQSSASAEAIRMDPDNKFLARSRRYRLDAEVLRDQVLYVSGLLVDQIGGPSVKPPQPDGLWFVVGYSGSNTVRFKKDEGHEKVHRRSMYTFWKRTAPAPQMNILDAPSRETCTVRRERTNTPLQALMLMNDPQYVEAARYFAQRAIDEGGVNPLQRIQWMFQRSLSRPATEQEATIIHAAFTSYLETFSSNEESARKLIAIGEEPAGNQYEPNELASWTMVSSLIMNMDEFVTRN